MPNSFSQIVFIRLEVLKDTNLEALRQIERESASLPVDVRRSKTFLLKLPVNCLKLTPCTVHCAGRGQGDGRPGKRRAVGIQEAGKERVGGVF